MRGYPEGCRPGAQIILIGRLNGYVNDQPMGEHAHHQQAAQMDAFALNIKQDTPVVASGEEGLRICNTSKPSMRRRGQASG
ncbi:MAG: hypothetical protein H6560_29595 [Lewinellaceae bacterium]|nr:hypothetical protein [Lewinellaceae bacterium]